VKLHRLELRAFGPFPDDLELDFDALSEAGLFLLTGPTGAGKTSILDAICFALYGDVPGDRSAAKRLRADQAPDGVAPRVSLECTLSGRRFLIHRSPSWERPKKRGAGTTLQQASVTFSERVDGSWSLLTSRIDEAGHLVAQLVGMNLAQFTQVAMLPQGRFQTFLRARSQERHQLLHQLFRTGRFEAVERWFRDSRLRLTAQSRSQHQLLADLVSRASEAAGCALPADWLITDLSAPARSGEVNVWIQHVVEQSAAQLRQAEIGLTRANQTQAQFRSQVTGAQELSERQQRFALAQESLATLANEAGQFNSLRSRLGAARRAGSLAPAQAAYQGALEGESAALLLSQSRRAALASAVSAEPELTELIDRPQRLQSHALAVSAQAQAFLPRAAQLKSLRKTIAGEREAAESLGLQVSALEERCARLPPLVGKLREQHSGAIRAAESLPRLTTELAASRRRHFAFAEEAELDAELRIAEEAQREVIDRSQALKEAWIYISEQRLAGMAAELARQIAVGGCCPVCGSASHPHLAASADGAPDAQAQKEARRLVDDAEAERLAHDALVRDLQTRRTTARALTAGLTQEGVHVELEMLRSRLQQAEGRAAELPELTAALARCEADQSAVLAERELLAARLSTHRAKLLVSVEAADEIQAQVDRLLKGSGRALSEHADLHDRVAQLSGDLLAAGRDLDVAQAHRKAAETALEFSAKEAGFNSVSEATRALAPPADAAAWEARLREYEHNLVTVNHVLNDPALVAAAGCPPPDLEALMVAHSGAQATVRNADTRAQLERTRSERLHSLADDLLSTLRDWVPLLSELDQVTCLSALVEGKSADNRLQMRLSAYVLSYRLSQVVAAANERLDRMSDHRYALEHSSFRGAGETRGGLSLLVRDDWSGESRDPATLSGGETFVVSLALALGLADVITQEAGGNDLDTLFVDEGFGALDADTLDDVMDVLDSLRDGGRVVGVVSHVPELRDRIPAQVAVAKSRAGSTAAVVVRG
jgi:exonuclease SbcC